jgi:hypothetical protein
MIGTASSRNHAITGVEISVFAHATEDEEKVERALRNVIPDEVEGVNIERHRLKGHYNDAITLIRATIKKKREATETFLTTMKALSTIDQYRLVEEVEERVDDAGSLYLRLDKQRALGGVKTINEADPIRIRFRFRIPHGSDPTDFIRSSIAAAIDVDDTPATEKWTGAF